MNQPTHNKKASSSDSPKPEKKPPPGKWIFLLGARQVFMSWNERTRRWE